MVSIRENIIHMEAILVGGNDELPRSGITLRPGELSFRNFLGCRLIEISDYDDDEFIYLLS